jgi:hypothetical protein
MGIGKERRRLGLGREVLMMSWGSVRAGCLLALSGGRRGIGVGCKQGSPQDFVQVHVHVSLLSSTTMQK